VIIVVEVRGQGGKPAQQSRGGGMEDGSVR